MRSLKILLILIGALALLALGAVSATAASAQATPCHAMVGSEMAHHDGGRHDGQPAPKAAAAMTCCVSCVTPPLVLDSPVAIRAGSAIVVTAAPMVLPLGLSPAPAHEPPKA